MTQSCVPANKSRRLFWMLFLLVAAINTSAPGEQPEKTKVPVSPRPNVVRTITFQAAIEQHLKHVKPAEREKIIQNLIKAGVVPDVPGLWQIHDPEAIWQAINHFNEPYAVPMIQALDRVHLKLKDTLRQDEAAAILYRYNRPSGEAFLEQRLVQQNDVEAADFFAFRKSDRLLPFILRVIESNPDRSAEIIQDMRSWQSPAVADGLLKAFRNDQDNANYVFPLADQKVQAAQSLIRKLYVTSSPEEGGKVAAAAALIRLDAPEKSNMMVFLEQTLNSPKSEDAIKSYVIDALSLTDAKWATPLLENLVVRYLNQTPQEEMSDQHNTQRGIDDDNFATQAAAALAVLHAETATDNVTQLLVKLKTRGADPRLLASAAQSVLELEGPQQTVKQTMGDEWLKRDLAKQKLNPLPESLTPQEVR